MTKNLVTKAGFYKLQEELNALWREERPRITKIVTWAAGLGDRSENADYQYNKKRLREIDRRVRFLRKVLENATIVEYHDKMDGKVFFGAQVGLSDIDNKTMSFRIVGTEEIYHHESYISLNAPIAKACLGKAIDEEVIVQLPDGKKTWYVDAIDYPKDN